MRLETLRSYYTLSACRENCKGKICWSNSTSKTSRSRSTAIVAIILDSIALVTLLRCHSLHEPLETDETIFSVIAHDRLNGPIWKYSCCRCCWRQWLAAECNYLERYRAANIYREKPVSVKDRQ